MGGKQMGPVVLERRFRPWPQLLAVWIGAVVLAMATVALVLILDGDPVTASLRAMWNATFGSPGSIGETLVASTPLILTGLAVAVARRMRLWNLGAEGQLYVGATFATALALWYPNAPRPILVLAMLAAGALGGAMWTMVPALLKAGLRVNEIITTALLNVAAVVFVQRLVQGSWRDPLAVGYPLTKTLTLNATLPTIPGTAVHGGFLVAVGAALLFWLVMALTPWGAQMGSPGGPGGNPSGKGVARNIVLVMLASGALAGIAGMGEVSGVAHRLRADVSGYAGYIGILVAVLGRFSPVGVLVLAVPFGALLVAGTSLQALGVAASIVRVVQSTIVLIALAATLATRFRVRWAARQAG
jgi:general nucleoside transport system permease protein